MASRRILVIDNDVEAIDTLVEFLQAVDPDLDVKGTTDPAEALRLVRDQHVDLVMADLRMGPLDGVGLLAKVRELSPETRRILWTVHNNDLEVRTARDDGIVHDVADKLVVKDLLDIVEH